MNKSCKLIILFIFTSLVTLSGCKSGDANRPSCLLLVPPPITMTGEKTAVENQIIGEYNELEKDAWVVSSVKTNVQKGEGKTAAAGSDIIMLKAMKTRELHEPKIRKYKDEGALGEGNNGFIAYRSAPKYDRDKELKEILNTVIKEENRARKTIFERTLEGSGTEKPGEKELKAFGRIFAEEQRALALKKDWIQDESGNWVRKK